MSLLMWSTCIRMRELTTGDVFVDMGNIPRACQTQLCISVRMVSVIGRSTLTIHCENRPCPVLWTAGDFHFLFS